jgi:MFS family permease
VVFRFLTGAGIGGEYTAINSTIQELIRRACAAGPISSSTAASGSVRRSARGVDRAAQPGAIAGRHRLARGLRDRALLSTVIFVMRMWIPESPRWLVTHGRPDEAEAIVASIETSLRRQGHYAERRAVCPHSPPGPLAHAVAGGGRRAFQGAAAALAGGLEPDGGAGLLLQCDLLHLRADPDGLLWRAADHVGWYILPFAAGNFLGPLLLGRLFDTWGRRPMISITYAISGLLLAATGFCSRADVVTCEN